MNWSRPLRERLEARSIPEPNSGCLLWIGHIDRKGYGALGSGKFKKLRAHKASYELERGPVPDGLVLDHLCRNKACINPDHLEAVTSGENTKRAFRLITQCRRGHPLSGANLYVARNGHRACRACRSFRRGRS